MSSQILAVLIFAATVFAFLGLNHTIPLWVTSLTGMLLMTLSGCLAPENALRCFSHPSVILMASIFVVAAGLNRTRIVSQISRLILQAGKGSFVRVLAGYVLLTFVLAQFIPSAAACISIVCPLGAAACREMKVPTGKMMYSLGITAIATVITLPLSSSFQEVVRIQGFLDTYQYGQYGMSVGDIFFAKFPVAAAIILLAVFVIPRLVPEGVFAGEEDPTQNADKPDDTTDPRNNCSQTSSCYKAALPVWKESIAYGTFLFVLLGLVLANQLGLIAWQICLAGALIVAASRILTFPEILESMNWEMIFLYIGALGIGAALDETGAAATIGNLIGSAVLLTRNNYIAGLLLFLVPFLMAQLMINLGVYSVFVPLYIMLCRSLQTDPTGPILLCLIASLTAFLTPFGNAAMPLVMKYGHYTLRDLLRMGILPMLIVIPISVGVVMTLYPIFP